jgi:parallel beta-helix repeat protein
MDARRKFRYSKKKENMRYTKLSLLILEDRLAPATFTVTSNGNSGPNTLRQAILDANSLIGADNVDFNLIDNQISLSSALPAITDQLSIDGGGLVEINQYGLSISAPGCEIFGLTLSDSNSNGILVNSDGDDCFIHNNNIGVSVDGLSPALAGQYGINLQFCDDAVVQDNFIGGVIGGIGGHPTNATITGNSVGANINGIFLNGSNNEGGIELSGGSGNSITDNTILGGNFSALKIQNSDDNTVTTNTIGSEDVIVDYGVFLFGAANNNNITNNIVSGYTAAGIVIGENPSDLSVANVITGNSFSGVGEPIDLGNDGFNPGLSGGVGPNNLQGSPLLFSAVTDGTTTTVQGTATGPSGKPLHIELYAQVDNVLVLIDSQDVFVDEDGRISFTFNVDSLPVGTPLSATATDDTSEFSRKLFVINKEITDFTVLAVGTGVGEAHALLITGTKTLSVSPFEGYFGGVAVATGDLNGDGVADLVTATATSSSHVKVFDGKSGELIQSFIAFEGFSGGVSVASGDVNGDGFSDVIVGSVDGSSHIKVFDGKTGELIHSFIAFEGYSGGVSVASGDVNGDGFSDVVVGSNSFGHVKVFSGSDDSVLLSFLPFSGYAGAVTVASSDVNDDGFKEVVAVSSGGHVKVFGENLLDSYLAFGSLSGGVTRVGAKDSLIVTSPSTGGVIIGLQMPFTPFPGFLGPLFVAL